MTRAVENAPQENAPRHVSVDCPACGARLRPEVRSLARTVKCPDCSGSVRVPGLADLARAKKRKRAVPAEETETDDLAEALDEDFGVPDRVRVTCSKCRTGLRAPVKDQPRHVPCPKCSTDVPVPGRKELARTLAPPPVVVRKKAKSSRRKPKPSEPSLIDVFAAVREEPIPDAPRWPFVLGVFTFPWHPDVFLRWAFLSVGFSVVGLLVVGVAWCLAVGGPMLRAAYAFSFPLCWIGLWTISYGAACALVVVEQTANGNQEIGEWPEPQWTGWLLEMIHVLAPAIGAGVIAWGIALVFKMATGFYWVPLLVSFFILFPILWLSSLECTSIFLPFSPPVLKSLGNVWWAWLLFYIEAAALLLLWPGSLLLGLSKFPFETAMATGPLLAAAVLIYVRLLGRLAWCATFTVEPDPEDE